MAHEVETMAYANETPWHGLGYPVPSDLTPEQMLKAAKLDWTVKKQKVFLEDNTEIPRKFALVRDSDERVIDIVGKDYKVTQNSEVLEFFHKFVTAGDMEMETAGSLQNGNFIWALARVNADFAIGKGSSADEMRSYLLFCNPHIYGYSRVLKFTSVRVVCWNTLNFALGSSLTGKRTRGQSFSIPHSVAFDEQAKVAAETALGLAKRQAKEFEEAARLLSKAKAPKEAVEKYFWNVIGLDPEKAKKRKDGSERVPSMVMRFQEALENAPGADLRSAKGTWWGAVNAVTYSLDHEHGRTRDNGLYYAWFGYTELYKRKAMELALVNAS